MRKRRRKKGIGPISTITHHCRKRRLGRSNISALSTLHDHHDNHDDHQQQSKTPYYHHIISCSQGEGRKRGGRQRMNQRRGASDLGEVDSERSWPESEFVLVVWQPGCGLVCPRSSGRHSQRAFRSWSLGCVWQASSIGRGQRQVREGKGKDANRGPPPFDRHFWALASDSASELACLHICARPCGRLGLCPTASLAGNTSGRRHFLVPDQTPHTCNR